MAASLPASWKSPSLMYGLLRRSYSPPAAGSDGRAPFIKETAVLHKPPNTPPALVPVEEIRGLMQTDGDFGLAQLTLLRRSVSRVQAGEVRREVTALRAQVDAGGKTPAGVLAKVGVALSLLGQHNAARDYLTRAGRHPVALFFLGVTAVTLAQPADAIRCFQDAAAAGFDPVDCELERVGALRMAGQLDAAQDALKKIASKAVSRADYSFQSGCLMADRGDTFGAVEYFERAIDMDPYHTRALFWLANENSRHGNDDEAIALYERALSRPPMHIGALLNLGLLYEDADRNDLAAFCFRRVLEADPANARARLYLKDIDATEGVVIDEESLRSEQKLRQTLSRSIADFELSVRSRNCLERLNLRTLGDLTQVTEPELLAARNFGETSLKEVRELMAQHGLAIGGAAAPTPADAGPPAADLSPEQQVALGMSIPELNLSVRARKCMSRLGLLMVADLVARTPDELLATRNFGVTSLNEIRAKLEELGLHLRND